MEFLPIFFANYSTRTQLENHSLELFDPRHHFAIFIITEMVIVTTTVPRVE
jgi:hypothetical protein